jgi:hypothetical protein
LSDWRVSRIAAWLAIISVTLRPEPKLRTIRRNGRSETPVIGARITGVSIRTLPIWIGFKRATAPFALICLPKKAATRDPLLHRPATVRHSGILFRAGAG